MGLGLAFKMLINQTSSNRDFIGNDRASRHAGSCVHDDNIFDCIAKLNLTKIYGARQGLRTT